MKRLPAGAAVVVIACINLVATAPPANANGCHGISAPYETCVARHGPWTGGQPKPLVSWGVFTGTIRADVQGDFGSASIMECRVLAGKGECRMTREEPLQCCIEPWALVCLAVGIGTWECDHTET